ncbi:GTP cyclohydrolase [marine bacterium AO1-C]|nr:GTP cyclohydrolase [marine bacterium AO1-C]
MFIINLTYKTELEKVEQFLDDHIKFLNEQYALGNFIASGRKVPRTGGIILSNIKDESALEEIIEKDPFKAHDLADFELIQFVPSKTSEELKFLIE